MRIENMNQEQLKREAEICAYGMRMYNNFPSHIIKDNRYDGYDLILSEISNSKTINELNNAYVKYIDFVMKRNWGVQYIIGGIMNNPEQNARFGVNIDNMVKIIMDINSGKIQLSNLLLTYEAEEKKDSEVIHKLEEHTEVEQETVSETGTNPEQNVGNDDKFEELKNKFTHITDIAER